MESYNTQPLVSSVLCLAECFQGSFMLFNSVMRGRALPAVEVGGLEAVRDQHGHRSIGIEFWLSLVGSTVFFALFFSRLPFLTAYTD